MECVVYRRQISPQSDPQTGSGVEDDSALKARPLSPALFYPLVTEQEKITWMHWLPTSLGFECDRVSSRDISYALARLKAPAEVLEEFHWAWNMGLFEAYEICTPPVRRDSRDPLLMGRLGTQWYRLALWGESLLPLEEIAALVQESLRRRARSARLRVGLGLGGTLPGLALVLWLGYLLWNGQPVGTRLLLTFLIFFFTWLPMLVYTPENCQHDFLDRYRR